MTWAADWEVPKDGLFTEAQLTKCIEATKELRQYVKAVTKAMEGSKSGAGALSVAATMDAKIKAIYEKNGLQKNEYEWLSGQITNCLAMLLVDENLDAGVKDNADQKTKNVADQAAAAEKIKTYKSALAKSIRVLTDEQRAERVKDAKTQQTSAEDEAKTHTDEVKAAREEAEKAEASANESAGLAKKPPADVEADSKADYVKGKTDEAANFRTAAKEAGDREKEAKKLEAESLSKAAGFAKVGAHPEIPVTPEDIEQVKKDNEQGIVDATAEAETLVQAAGILKDAEAQLATQRADFMKELKPQNLKLVKVRADTARDAWGFPKK